MRYAILLLSVSLYFVPSSAVSESLVFYIAQISDHDEVELSIAKRNATSRQDYDFDVSIVAADSDLNGHIRYSDPSLHSVSVRCSAPTAVIVKGVDYPIPSSRPRDWKNYLWDAICLVPVS